MGNPVVHFEIQAKDTKRQTAFYQGLFGWKISTNNPMNYGIINTGVEGSIDGGIAKGDAPMVTFYVEVDDPQAALDKVAGMGGKVVQPVTDIPGMVTLALFADPEGNVIGLVKGHQA